MSASDHRETCRSDGNGNAEIGSVEADYAEIVVVRHGETEWNSDSRIQGHLDVELNQAGKQQAAAVADRLSREGKINSVYSSDLKRAFETAQAIVTACGGLEVIKDPKLRERNLGDLQGLQLKEAANLKPLAYKAFLSNRTDQEIPIGGKFLVAVKLRLHWEKPDHAEFLSLTKVVEKVSINSTNDAHLRFKILRGSTKGNE
ncbi:phosphoglycerate mutase-like protein 4 isoform X2 [Punica granatum]|uniref:Phosphoglycerate mutase-like protein 4 isoform X2 n=1 Tax=Punica granatum TaxID=22663 RepID=A0A6P8CLX7_PUNGR|nr:phosphoglycerate mutase-like protein 4 isoform X2 [Punica granatum]